MFCTRDDANNCLPPAVPEQMSVVKQHARAGGIIEGLYGHLRGVPRWCPFAHKHKQDFGEI